MRNLLILPLVAPCFSAHSQLGELVGEVFLTYETCFTTVEIEGCTLGESYILQAEGLYTVWGGSCDRGDPAFDALDLGTPNPYSPWVWNDVVMGVRTTAQHRTSSIPTTSTSFPLSHSLRRRAFTFRTLADAATIAAASNFRITAPRSFTPNRVPNEGLAYWSSFNGVAEDESGNAISATIWPYPTTDHHGTAGWPWRSTARTITCCCMQMRGGPHWRKPDPRRLCGRKPQA